MTMDPQRSPGGTHSYYDWQVSTLLLAYDTVEPLAREDVASLQKRQQAVELEVRKIALSVIPPAYERSPEKEIPPEVILEITKATLRRAAEVARVV